MPGIPEIPGHMGTLAAQIGCGRANCEDRALGRMTRPSALRGADGRIGRSVEYNRVPAGCACGIYARAVVYEDAGHLLPVSPPGDNGFRFMKKESVLAQKPPYKTDQRIR